MEIFNSIIHSFELKKLQQTLDNNTDSPIMIKKAYKKAPPKSALPKRDFNTLASSVQKHSMFEELPSSGRSPLSNTLKSF